MKFGTMRRACSKVVCIIKVSLPRDGRRRREQCFNSEKRFTLKEIFGKLWQSVGFI